MKIVLHKSVLRGRGKISSVYVRTQVLVAMILIHQERQSKRIVTRENNKDQIPVKQKGQIILKPQKV